MPAHLPCARARPIICGARWSNLGESGDPCLGIWLRGVSSSCHPKVWAMMSAKCCVDHESTDYKANRLALQKSFLMQPPQRPFQALEVWFLAIFDSGDSSSSISTNTIWSAPAARSQTEQSLYSYVCHHADTKTQHGLVRLFGET